MLKGDESLVFDFSVNIELTEDDFDPYCDNYFQYMESSIILQKSSKRKKIGMIELIYLHGNRAINNNLDIVEICDSENQELYDYSRNIYRNGRIMEKYNDLSMSDDVLVIHKVLIEKPFQGNGYGLFICKKMIDIFGSNCGGTLITPCPMQFSIEEKERDNWNKKYLSERFDIDGEKGRIKLLKYWKQLSKYAITIKTITPNMLFIPQ